MLVYSLYERDNRVLRYAETLARRGHHVDVIALRKPGQSFIGELRGVKIYRIQTRKRNEKKQLSYLMKLTNFFVRSTILLSLLHLRKSYSLIHVHNMPDLLVFAAFFPKLMGAKVILDIHDLMPELYATKFNQDRPDVVSSTLVSIEKMCCAFSDHIIIANHLWHKRLIARSVKDTKCSVVLNYPDENIFFRRLRKGNNDKFVMIYPGSLNWHQGVDIAIKAFRMVADDIDAQFHIYGEGNFRTSLENLIGKLGLKERVYLMEPLPIDEVAEKMANADLGIEPKRNNSFAGDAMSTKILEFMSLGVPVIVSGTRIHKHYFNEHAVQFFNAEDENDLARCMLLMYRDSGLREDLGRRGYEFAKNYAWDKRKDEYLYLVKRITAEGKVN